MDQQCNILHFGTPPDYDPGLTEDLLKWKKNSEVHMLIRSYVFHYELEQSHPFAWWPVKSMIHADNWSYYDAINAANAAGSSTAFIEFMLSVIKAPHIETIKPSDAMSDGKTDKETLRWMPIYVLGASHPFIMNAAVRTLCSATANRVLASLSADGKLKKCRRAGHWVYQENRA